jgi:hypothetical protein
MRLYPANRAERRKLYLGADLRRGSASYRLPVGGVRRPQHRRHESLATVRVVYPLENAPVWLERAVIDRLRSLRGRGESYSDVILRLVLEG